MSPGTSPPQAASRSEAAFRVFRGDSITLRIARDVLERLEMAVRQGIKAIPKRGLEVGGLLAGNNGIELEIDGLCNADIEYRFGPCFELTPGDLMRLASQRDEFVEEGFRPIGHFRSQTEGEPHITEADDAIASLLETQAPILLLIPASQAGLEDARIYRRSAGEWKQLMVFRLSEAPAARPAVVSEPRPQISKAGSPNDRGFAPVVSFPTAPEKPRPVYFWNWRMGALLSGVLLCAFLLGYGIMRWRSKPGAGNEIGLSVRSTGQGLKVVWNQQSPVLLGAKSGVLTIQDGDEPRQVMLTVDELRHGTLVYVPQSPSAQFRLEVYTDGTHYAGESVIVATGIVAKSSSRTATTGTRDRLSLPPLRPATIQMPVHVASMPSSQVEPKEEVVPASPPLPGREFVPPPTQPGSGDAEPALPVPPQISQAERLRSALLPKLDLPAPPKPVVDAPINYSAAVPLRRYRPTVPPGLRPMLEGGTSIEVKITIAPNGSVVEAAPLNAATSAQRQIAPYAVQAARLWRFSPALRNGRPVTSETILRFDFTRGSQ
ncbi:MAG: energy transducer TonB [Bryobacteraceae bacterium]